MPFEPQVAIGEQPAFEQVTAAFLCTLEKNPVAEGFERTEIAEDAFGDFLDRNSAPVERHQRVGIPRSVAVVEMLVREMDGPEFRFYRDAGNGFEQRDRMGVSISWHNRVPIVVASVSRTRR